MELNEYQRLASRTINKSLTKKGQESHSLHGMVGEIGEIHSLYQKKYQGHTLDKEHAISEIGDLMWFVAEYCTALDVTLNDVCLHNISKLQKRYPEGFEEEKSLFRAEGDI